MFFWYQNQNLPRRMDAPSIPSFLKCWQAGRAFSTYFNDFPLWRWVKCRRGEQIAVSQVIFLSWRLVRELPQMFFHQISAAVLPCASFSRSRFCAFLLFWHVFSVHLPSLTPPSPPTIFYVSALNVFKQGDTTLTGSERGPAHKYMHKQDHFKRTNVRPVAFCICPPGSRILSRRVGANFRLIFTKFAVGVSLFRSHTNWAD